MLGPTTPETVPQNDEHWLCLRSANLLMLSSAHSKPQHDRSTGRMSLHQLWWGWNELVAYESRQASVTALFPTAYANGIYYISIVPGSYSCAMSDGFSGVTSAECEIWNADVHSTFSYEHICTYVHVRCVRVERITNVLYIWIHNNSALDLMMCAYR